MKWQLNASIIDVISVKDKIAIYDALARELLSVKPLTKTIQAGPQFNIFTKSSRFLSLAY